MELTSNCKSTWCSETAFSESLVSYCSPWHVSDFNVHKDEKSIGHKDTFWEVIWLYCIVFSNCILNKDPQFLTWYVPFILYLCFSLFFCLWNIISSIFNEYFFIFISVSSIHRAYPNTISLRSQFTCSILAVVLFTDFNEITARKICPLSWWLTKKTDQDLRNQSSFRLLI